jgi:hypothetical protein
MYTAKTGFDFAA